MTARTASYLAEFLGTFVFILLGAGSVAVNAATGGQLGLLGIALAHGIGILTMVYAFYHVSGAHFNPAVTISMWAVRRIETKKMIGYIIVQLAGATLACIFIQGLFTPNGLVVPSLAGDITPLMGIIIEATLTFALVLTIFGTAVDTRSNKNHAGLAIGLVIAGLVLVGGPLTGGAVNPVRDFGPAAVTGDLTNQFVWWIGPIAGAIAAALIYDAGFLRTKD